MKLTYFQKDRAQWWRIRATLITILLGSIIGVYYGYASLDRAYLSYAGLIGGALYAICLVASYSHTLLGGYRYFVWEKDGAVHVWDSNIKPTDYFAFGIPTHGLFLEPVVFVPKFEQHGWSLRVLPDGNLALRDRDGAQQRFVFGDTGNERAIRNATEVLRLLRDAYWADTSVVDKDGHGTIWWAERRREHRYWDVVNDRTLLADAFALVAGRLEKCAAPGRFADAVKSPTGAWALSFTRRVLAWALPTDDPRRNTLAITERLPGSRRTVELEVEAGPDGPLPKRLPAERVEALSSADAPSGA